MVWYGMESELLGPRIIEGGGIGKCDKRERKSIFQTPQQCMRLHIRYTDLRPICTNAVTPMGRLSAKRANERKNIVIT